jgi:hypothetical protein
MGMDVRAFILAKVARSTSRGLGMGRLRLLGAVGFPVGFALLVVARVRRFTQLFPPGVGGYVGLPKFRVGAVAQMGMGRHAVRGQEARRQVEVGARGTTVHPLPEGNAHVFWAAIAGLADPGC